jgi:hypothetical protein
MYRMRHSALACALVMVLGLCAPIVARADMSVDQSLLDIEQVNARLSATESMAESVLTYIAEHEGLSNQTAKTMIKSAIKPAFNAQMFTTEMLHSLGEVSTPSVDARRLVKIAHDLKIRREKLAKLREQKGEETIKDESVELAEKADRPTVKKLSELMASPELAAETALTAQVVYAAAQSFFNPDRSQLTSLTPEQQQMMAAEIVDFFRKKEENEKPLSMEIERNNEKIRISMALVGLSEEDLNFLLKFYESAEGKAKRDQLVTSYKDVADRADQKMLQDYFNKLSDYLKANPK